MPVTSALSSPHASLRKTSTQPEIGPAIGRSKTDRSGLYRHLESYRRIYIRDSEGHAKWPLFLEIDQLDQSLRF
jgi:hypothetical protein